MLAIFDHCRLRPFIHGVPALLLCGIPLGTWIGSLYGWRASFAFAAGLGALALAAVAPTLPYLPGTRSRGLRGIAVVGRAAVAGHLALTTGAFVAVFCVNAYIGPVLTRAAGLDGAGIAAMQVLLGVGSVLGVPLGGMLADRGSRPGAIVALIAAIVIAQPVYSVFMLVPAWSGTTAAIVCIGLAMITASAVLFALGPILQDRLITLAPEERDVVLSLNASALFLGQGIGAAVGGLTALQWSLAANGLAGGAIAMACLAAIAALGSAPFEAGQAPD